MSALTMFAPTRGVRRGIRYVSASRLVGDGLDRELMRKAIHLLVALVPPLASVNPPATIGLLAIGTLFYAAAESLRLSGACITLVSELTIFASRDRDTGFVLGPVTLGLGAMLALTIYPQPASAIAIYALAFGDAAASLVGIAVGGRQMPFARDKTISGSLACLMAVFLVTLGLSGDARLAIAVGMTAALIEAVASRDLDNLLLPVGTGLVAQGLLPEI